MSARALPIAALALGLLWFGAVPGEAQCAMCRATLEGSEQGRAIGAAFNGAILVMLAAPYLLAGGFAAVLFRRQIGAWLVRRTSRLHTSLRRTAASPRPV